MYKLYHVGSRRSTKDNRNIITAMVAAHVIYEIVSLIADRRRTK